MVSGSKQEKIMKWVSVGFTLIVLVFVGWTLLGSTTSAVYENDTLSLKASMTGTLSVTRSEMASVEWVDTFTNGKRTWGLGTSAVCAGNFENDTLGSYTLYAWNAVPQRIVITTNSGKKIAFNCKTSEESKTMFYALSA